MTAMNNQADESKGGDMDDKMETRQRRWWVIATLLCVGAAVAVLPAIAESGQTELGISQPPLVTIIFDSSGSMQWTEKGEATYPELAYDGGMTSTNAENHLDTWVHGTKLNLPRSSQFICGGWCHFDKDGKIECPHLGNNLNQYQDNCDYFEEIDTLEPPTITSVGPCMVWHPLKDHEKNEQSSNNNTCKNYDRPPPCNFADDECEFLGREFGKYDPNGFEERMEAMANDPKMRLSDEQTPRHIQIKQILTGDMSLNGDDGPGCWFVPRARGAISEEQVCCPYMENGRCYDDDKAKEDDREHAEIFESYVDYDDPVPHFQEVYDRDTQGEGLLDMIGSTGIFSVAMFDGYRGDGTRNDNGYGWDFPTTDIMAGGSPYGTGYADCGNEDSSGCDNLGLFRWVGPTNFAELDPAGRMAAADYVQDAILDAGFLIYDEDGDPPTKLETIFHTDHDGVTFDYPLGQQPIAQASPLGPAFHDLHQFYTQGQELGMEGGEGDLDPWAEDPYRACRARHSVIFTDGMAEPEAPGGAGDGLGSDILMGGGFGYHPDRFPYPTTEEAIEEMIEDAKGDALDNRFEPKVHVIGAGLEGDLEGSDEQKAHRIHVLHKLAAMAQAGQTCAQYYLPASMIPYEDGNGDAVVTLNEDGEEVDGRCGDPDDDYADGPCLALQRNVLDDIGLADEYQGYDYCPPGSDCTHDEESSETFECDHPALVLTENDRESMRRAFTLIFNEIAGTSGLSATTRPSITNQVDRGSDEPGQYRIYSGLRVAGDNPHWKGLLARQFLECGDDGTIQEAAQDFLHDDMVRLRVDLTDEELFDDDDELIDEELQDAIADAMDGSVDGDRRRIFTSVPMFIGDDVKEDDMDQDGDIAGSVAYSSPYLESAYQLYQSQTDDVFGDNYDLPNVSAPSVLRKSRVPFYHDALYDTFTENQGADMGSSDFYDYWGVSGESELREVIDDYRGRTAFRGDRVLGAIRNSNPVSVGAPRLDLPIDSYRSFQRLYAQRPTMTYVSTLDGQLRAIHTGEPDNVMVNEAFEDEHGDQHEKVGSVVNQREAWAYIPQLLHERLADFSGQTAPDSLIDGSPVVRDVRLCQRGKNFSANRRACPDTGRESEWRTVLVQGMGLAGSGYFALDVTRSGINAADDDNVKGPDPLVLWEFGPDWEAMQLQHMDSDLLYRPEVTPSDDCLDDFDSSDLPTIGDTDIEEMWEMAMLGSTVGEPAIGSINLRFADSDDQPQVVQRPVAVVGAGTASNASAMDPFSDRKISECTEDLIGKAVYVIDLQSGQLLRRFVESDEGIFDAEMTGTPVLSGGSPGEVSTRGFIGDSDGRMYRIDFTSTDPANWEMTTFFDPKEEIDDIDEDDELGPAAFRPAITRGTNREIVVVYGLGQQDDSGGEGTVQMMIGVRESFELVGDDVEINGREVWSEIFEGGGDDASDSEVERLTGAPVIFNNDVFFTTYIEDVEERCEAGYSRIYRLHYNTGAGGWDDDEVHKSLDKNDVNVDDPRFIQTVDPMLIRGMAITMGPNCGLAGSGALGSAPQQRPQLVAQTGAGRIGTSDDADEGSGAAGGGEIGGIGTIAVDLEMPDTRLVPVSWSVLEH